MVSSCSSLNLGLGFSLLEKGDANSVVPKVLGAASLDTAPAAWRSGCAHHPFSILLLLFSPPHLFPRAIPSQELPWEAGDGFGVLDGGSFPIFLVFPRTKSLLSPWWV